MKHNILICGLGHIGFRHAQSLIENDNIKKIYIYDRKKSRYKKFLNNFDNIQKRKLVTLSNLKKKKLNFFLSIISTTSNNRYLITNKIFKSFNVKYFLLEKFLEDDFSRLKMFKKFKEGKIFVNYNWRYYPFIKLIKKKVKNFSNFKIVLTGQPWNLASNSLHILDAIKSISVSKLKKIYLHKDIKLIKSKRRGFNELTGTISIELSKKILLKLISKNKLGGKKMIFSKKNLNLCYDFTNSKITINKKSFYSKIKHVSETTSMIYKDLLNKRFNKICTLSDILDDSIIFLSAMKQKYKKIKIT